MTFVVSKRMVGKTFSRKEDSFQTEYTETGTVGNCLKTKFRVRKKGKLSPCGGKDTQGEQVTSGGTKAWFSQKKKSPEGKGIWSQGRETGKALILSKGGGGGGDKKE